MSDSPIPWSPSSFFSEIPPPPSSTLFPYTTLFRSDRLRLAHAVRHLGGAYYYAGRAKLAEDRKSTRLNSSHITISYAVFCLKKKTCAFLPSGFLPPSPEACDQIRRFAPKGASIDWS